MPVAACHVELCCQVRWRQQFAGMNQFPDVRRIFFEAVDGVFEERLALFFPSALYLVGRIFQIRRLHMLAVWRQSFIHQVGNNHFHRQVTGIATILGFIEGALNVLHAGSEHEPPMGTIHSRKVGQRI